jgi:hypothetical protein
VLLSGVVVIVGFMPLFVDDVDYRPATAHAGLALVAGLVLTEQWLRWRSGRSAR